MLLKYVFAVVAVSPVIRIPSTRSPVCNLTLNDNAVTHVSVVKSIEDILPVCDGVL